MKNFEFEHLKPISIGYETNSSIDAINEIKINIRIIILNIVSFTSLYFSFSTISLYYFNIYYFLYPIDILPFIFIFISSIISSYTICLTIQKRINYIHILYSLIYYIIIFFVNHNTTMGKSHFDKSFINFYVFTFLTIQNICFYFSYQIISYFYYLFNYKDKEENSDVKFNIKNFVILILLFINLILLHTLLEIKKEKIFKCDHWDIGLNGTSIINDNLKYSCEIKKPQGYCKMDYFKGYFDLTYSNYYCSVRDAEKEKYYFMKNLRSNINIDKDTKIFGFPYTNHNKKYYLKNQIDIVSFGTLVNNDIFSLNENNNIIPPEAILDFSENNIYKGEYGELKINLNFDKALSDQRKLLENTYSLYDNILMIYIDATSRAHFQRTFPKLSGFIKNYMSYDPLSLKKLKSYQFMKYHSFGAFTPINIIPMFYGNSMKSNRGVHSVKYFKENGFITGHIVDMCNKEQYDIFYDENDEKEYEEWDHENIAFLCDGNYFEIDNPFQYNKGPYSIRERCLYGYPIYHYMIDYAIQFWEKYSINKKYFRIAFNYGHEKTGNVVSFLDEPLYQMIFNFYEKGYLEKTALFIVSDHGNQNRGIYNNINSAEFELEKKFGIFFLLLYKNENKEFEEHLINNQQILVTPYDIHDTMMHIIYGNNIGENIKKAYSVNNKGNSVFNYIDPKERNCQKYDDDFDEDFCGCI